MDAKGFRNMCSILVVVNKHNTARVASCWFIIYYRLMMHGNSNIKNKLLPPARREVNNVRIYKSALTYSFMLGPK